MKPTEFRVLSPTGMLGYGFPEESFRRGMDKQPHVVGVDAGSTDPGPYYLGAGKSFTNRAAVKRDLQIILKATVPASVPFVIGSAGGCGARVHVDWTREIIEEIAREQGLAFRMAVAYGDVSKSDVVAAFDVGRVRPLGPAPELTREDIDNATRIVAQMGPEPVYKALDAGCDVVLCGRCYDPVPFAAPAIRLGFDPGLAYHMGKILECAAIAATPGSGCDCVLGTLRSDDFTLQALNPQRQFTRLSTAAHTLYEKSDPYHLPGPGGAIDLHDAVFDAKPDGTVQVSGTTFEPSDPYMIKLEGAERVGFRTICIAGVRDPILIGEVDAVLDEIRKLTAERFAAEGLAYELFFHVYGRDAIMGQREPERDSPAHELGIVIEVIAPVQDDAKLVCSFVRSTLLHYGYPARISTAGNLALLYSPSDIDCGEVYKFCIYHLMQVDHPEDLFEVEIVEVGR